MAEKKFSTRQIADLKHICNKGFAAYSKEIPELDELVEAGYLTKSPIGPFGEIGYKLTEKGKQLVHSL